MVCLILEELKELLLFSYIDGKQLISKFVNFCIVVIQLNLYF